MKQFHNPELNAPNVLKVDLDTSIVREVPSILSDRIGPKGLFKKSPPWKSDICWTSAKSIDAFSEFQSLFDRLGVAAHARPYLDVDRTVRLYNGFVVTRSVCEAPDFHVDWKDTNNEAFTLITPVTENSEGFGLLYKKSDGTIGEYEYKLGEALILGDRFIHSTKPGRSAEPVALLSFIFGSDKMIHWPKIARTAASQGHMVCRPDGTFQRRSIILRARNAAGRAARRLGLRR